MTESKKLQTTLDDLPKSQAHRDPRVWAMIHDARLAHEQREVIRQLMDALDRMEDRLSASIMSRPVRDLAETYGEAIAARKSAAPFLED